MIGRVVASGSQLASVETLNRHSLTLLSWSSVTRVWTRHILIMSHKSVPSLAPLVVHTTKVLPVDIAKIGQFVFRTIDSSFLDDWELKLAPGSTDAANLYQAAQKLQSSDIPVAFPTETVYGLGADATRSAAVQGIYKAKQRPSDNPLIVHVSSLTQLRHLLDSSRSSQDPIPSIYHPLIQKFWPGPLTILLPLPTPSPFAPEVSTALPTFGVRMPSSLLALALIYLADRPLAAPSANASSKPSATTAAHVLHDLSGRIEMVLDGGPCDIGVESTIVDGLSSPPLILRPGAVSMETIRGCEGWQNVRSGYADGPEPSIPRAPGMKYKHYSPRARVILVHGPLDFGVLGEFLSSEQSLGILQTRRWANDPVSVNAECEKESKHSSSNREGTGVDGKGVAAGSASTAGAQFSQLNLGQDFANDYITVKVWTIDMGKDTATIARMLFSAMRELDLKGVDVILVEAIDDREGDFAAAIMNRLRKAAEREIDTV